MCVKLRNMIGWHAKLHHTGTPIINPTPSHTNQNNNPTRIGLTLICSNMDNTHCWIEFHKNVT